MAGYIGSKSSVTQVDGYNRTEADAEFVNDPNSVITVSSGNVGIGTSSPDLSGFGSGTNGLEIADATIAGLRLNGNAADSLYLISGADKHWVFGRGAVPMTFSTNDTERMRIDSSGNVGIGTSSPSQKLHVEGAGNQFILLNNSTTNDGFYFKAGAGASSIQTNAGSHVMNFFTGGSERMRIDSSGNVLIGCTSVPSSSTPGAGFEASSLGRRILALSSSSTGGGVTLMSFRNPNGEVGSIKTSGSSTSFNTSSDYRLKTDAQPMTGASARVQSLNPVNFEWIADGTRVDGFLAHEAQAVVPEAVHGTKDAMRDEEYEVTPAIEATYDDDGNELTSAVDAVMGTRSVPDYQGIDQSKLVPLLTAALQEALNKIDDMETRLAALEGN